MRGLYREQACSNYRRPDRQPAAACRKPRRTCWRRHASVSWVSAGIDQPFWTACVAFRAANMNRSTFVMKYAAIGAGAFALAANRAASSAEFYDSFHQISQLDSMKSSDQAVRARKPTAIPVCWRAEIEGLRKPGISHQHQGIHGRGTARGLEANGARQPVRIDRPERHSSGEMCTDAANPPEAPRFNSQIKYRHDQRTGRAYSKAVPTPPRFPLYALASPVNRPPGAAAVHRHRPGRAKRLFCPTNSPRIDETIDTNFKRNSAHANALGPQR